MPADDGADADPAASEQDAPPAADTPSPAASPQTAADALPIARPNAAAPNPSQSASPTPLAVLPSLPPTPTPSPVPTPTPPPASDGATAGISIATQNQKRCDFWALNNLSIQVYNRFSTLEPYRMLDFDRALWRKTLHVDNDGDYYRSADRLHPRTGEPSEWCQDYWSEELSAANADKRNMAWKNRCYADIAEQADEINEDYGRSIYEERTPPDAINQYVRIMNWMDIGGAELMRMQETPYELIRRLTADENAHYATDGSAPSVYENLSLHELEWYGVARAWNKANENYGCGAYYPQLFHNRWIPLDTNEYGHNDATPVPLPDIAHEGPNRDIFVPDKYIRQ